MARMSSIYTDAQIHKAPGVPPCVPIEIVRAECHHNLEVRRTNSVSGTFVWPLEAYVDIRQPGALKNRNAIPLRLAEIFVEQHRTDQSWAKKGKHPRSFVPTCIAQFMAERKTPGQPELPEHDFSRVPYPTPGFALAPGTPVVPTAEPEEDTRVEVYRLIQELNIPVEEVPLGMRDWLNGLNVAPDEREGDTFPMISAEDAERIRALYALRRFVTTPATEEEMAEVRGKSQSQSIAPEPEDAPTDEAKPERPKQSVVQIMEAIVRHEQGLYFDESKKSKAATDPMEQARSLDRANEHIRNITELSYELRAWSAVAE